MQINAALTRWGLSYITASHVKQIYVFGYGSIISPASLATTLGNKALKLSIAKCHLYGFVREWTAFVPLEEAVQIGDRSIKYIAYLNVRETHREKEDRVNGVMIPVTLDDLQCLIKREHVYDAVDVTPLMKPELPSGHYAVTFVSRAQDSMQNYLKHAAVRIDYIALVEAAFAEIGESFLDEYRKSTLPTRLEGIEPEQIPGAARRFPLPD